MPVISMFYGIIVRMFHFDDKKHHMPHIHAEYQDETAVIDIGTGELLAGSLPGKKLRLVQAWIEIHKDELLADWKLASEGKDLFKINPLQ
jgi:desulfoferrodoxin (superoxide reductase-like protein)